MNKIILLTGATGALGKATALELAKTNAQLVLIGRNKLKIENTIKEIESLTGNKKTEYIIADFSDMKSVMKAADEFKKKHSQLHVLINAAAVYKNTHQLTTDGLEMMFATNHMAPFILTTELMNELKAGYPSRVITVSAPSSTKVDFNNLQGKKKFKALTAFGASKMMNLLFAYGLASRCKDSGISSNVFFPGLIKSELIHEMPGMLKFIINLMSKSPDKAAKALSSMAVSSQYEGVTGHFYNKHEKIQKTAAFSLEKENQQRAWEISENIRDSVREKVA